MEVNTLNAPVEGVEKKPIKKVCVICSKGTLQDVYAALVLANGAVMEGIEAHMFFTFFGLVAIQKGKQDHLHTATVGNPAFMDKMPTIAGALPGFEAFASFMMRKEMDKLDMPPVSEFLEMIVAGGGKLWGCKLACDMFKLDRDDLVDEVEDVITVGDFYALADGDRTQIIFI